MTNFATSSRVVNGEDCLNPVYLPHETYSTIHIPRF